MNGLWRTPQARHGWQLLAAVAVSYLVSNGLGLPESLWAVMSALIVVRPTTGSSLGVGWDRVRGAGLGAVFALAGVWLHHIGVATPVATLAIVGALAFGSATMPALRSAPITALIVLGGGGIAAHSAMQVGLMRVMEISVGVATGLAISLLGVLSRATGRFDAACAAILRQLSRDAGVSLGLEPEAPIDREAATTAARTALRELAVLADAADREDRWFRSARGDELRHRRVARLLARTSHDAALFGRLAAPSVHEATRAELASAISTALASTADALEGRGAQQLGSLQQARVQAPWTASAVTLLSQDLVGLVRLRSP
jgi:uncharacterized membrane protein YccC